MKKINKKGMELSINFIVILIISIVVFGFGIKILSGIFEGATEMEILTQEEINRHLMVIMCDSSERLCVAPTRIEARPHGSGYFTIGILNTYDDGMTFYIGVEESSSDEIPTIDEKYWLLGEDSVQINPNEQKKLGLGVLVPGGTKKGTYVLNVYVCSDEQSSCEEDSDNRYGATQKLYVVVP